MTRLIDKLRPEYRLGLAQMDETHMEFIDIVNAIGQVRGAEFSTLYRRLVEHTEIHFSQEEALMEETGFPAWREHHEEHVRVLKDMQLLLRMMERGSAGMARAFIMQTLPEWFDLHAKTMDAALATHCLRNKSKPRLQMAY